MKSTSNLRPKTEADQYAGLFAKSCVLLGRWLNVAEARRLARNDVERAKVAKIETDLVSATNEFLET